MLFASIRLFGLIFHLIVGSIGLEPMKTKANRFTVYPVDTSVTTRFVEAEGFKPPKPFSLPL